MDSVLECGTHEIDIGIPQYGVRIKENSHSPKNIPEKICTSQEKSIMMHYKRMLLVDKFWKKN